MGRTGWSALSVGAVVGYPLLMALAIRSVHYDADGLRVLWPAVVMGGVAGVLRRRPLLGLFLMIAGMTAVIVILGTGDVAFAPRVAVAISVGAVAAARPRWVGVTAALAALAAVIGSEVLQRAVELPIEAWGRRLSAGLAATSVLTYTLVIGVSLTIGLLVRQRREHAESLRARATTEALAGERLRIARELHDSVAHSIGIIALQAGAAHRVFDSQPVRAREALGVVETASREALGELRRMLGVLRESDVAETVQAGLADLDRLVASTTAAGVRVEVHRAGLPAPLPPEIDRSVFRIIQEAVTNVVRHAGADSCRVFVDCRDDAVSVEVLDDGPGRPGSTGMGFGLLGMRERVALLHGEFAAGPRVEGGYRVTARLPVPASVR